MIRTTLAALAALSLAAPALAQTLTLNSGDSVTVSSSGTHGTINGTPVNNATTGYTGGGGANSVTTNGTAGFTLGSGGSLSVAGNNGDALHSSGSGPVMVTGGTATGGGFGSGVFSDGTAPVQISGGTFGGGSTSVAAYSSGMVTITGGTFNSPLLAYVGGTITLAGGTINATGTTLTTTAGSTSTINLFGTGFRYSVNGTPGSTAITSGTLPTNVAGTITGTLTYSTMAFTTGYSNGGVINVNGGTPPGAPEPSPAAVLSIGILGLGALAIKAKRRTV